MTLTADEVAQATRVVEELNKTFRDKGLDDAFKLIEQEVDGTACYFFEFSLPALDVQTLTPVILPKKENK